MDFMLMLNIQYAQLMGLAVYNSITLDIRFPPCCYKKLLSPPIVPSDQNTPVGICSVTTDDLCQIMPVSIQLFSILSLTAESSFFYYSLSPPDNYFYVQIWFPFTFVTHLLFCLIFSFPVETHNPLCSTQFFQHSGTNFESEAEI